MNLENKSNYSKFNKGKRPKECAETCVMRFRSRASTVRCKLSYKRKIGTLGVHVSALL